MQQNLPKHIFVIPDGNRRWAKSRGLATGRGHLEGRERFHEISKVMFDLGIPFFTFWAMSENNLNKRGPAEIKNLISLLQESLRNRMADDLLKNQIRFRVLGRWRDYFFFKHLTSLIDMLENRTLFFDKYNLTILLGYDGKTELVEAIQKIIMNTYQLAGPDRNLKPDFETIRQAAWAGELPPVDLEIRTGEKDDGWFHNSSGAMMLHTTDSEIRSSKTFWPDFSEQELKKIIEEYARRERKLGR